MCVCVCVKVGSEVSKHLADAGVEVKPYTALLADIKTLAATNTKLWTDPAKVMHPCLLHNPFPVSPPPPPPPPPPNQPFPYQYHGWRHHILPQIINVFGVFANLHTVIIHDQHP